MRCDLAPHVSCCWHQTHLLLVSVKTASVLCGGTPRFIVSSVSLQGAETGVVELCWLSAPGALCGPNPPVNLQSCSASCCTTAPPSGKGFHWFTLSSLSTVPLTSLPVRCRKEVLALGLVVLVDARGAAPVPALFSALRSLQVSLKWTTWASMKNHLPPSRLCL